MEVIFKLYRWAEKYRIEIVGFFFAVSFVMGFFIYLVIYGLTFWDTLSYSLGLFAMDVKTPSEISDVAIPIDKINPYWYTIFIASTLAKFTVVLGVFLLFFRSWLSRWYSSRVIVNGDHTIVVGLGRNSRFFINSMLEKREYRHKIIAFEIDEENPYLETYKNKRVSIVIEDVERKLDVLNLEKCQNIFISTGSDEKNIYYALKFLETFKAIKNTQKQKLLVHIQDRTLRNFYSDTGVLHNYNIELKVFSFNKESARILFQEHLINGNSSKESENSEDVEIYVVGEDDLSISMVVEACKIAHFPDEKRLTINCIGKDTTAIKQKTDYSFPEIHNIENINIVYTNISPDTKEFYDGENELWRDIKNLKHVFYCYDDIMKNIKIATKVKDVTFLRRLEEGKRINFHIATMNHQKIAKEIDSTSQENVFIFAQAEEVCSYNNLINNDIDKIAKLINYDHFKANSTKEEIAKIKNADELWKETLINDKKSSMGQAIHIKTKLNYLGLKVSKSRTTNKERLLSENKKKIYKALEIKDISDFKLSAKMRKKLDKLVISEHNRWIALLQLMDYQLSKDGIKDKVQKYHPLLKHLSEFSEEELKGYALYDINSVLKIAEYEAHVGNEIKYNNYLF